MSINYFAAEPMKTSLSDKNLYIDLGERIQLQIPDGLYSGKDVREAVKELKEELRGIPIKDGYQDIIEIHKRIDEIFGEKLC